MKRRTGRWSAAVLTVLLPVGAVVGAVGFGLVPAAAAASRPAQAVTTVPTVPAAGSAPATTVAAPAPVETAVPGSPTPAPTADRVGDPVADRRIRNIVLALGALALIVLITTIVFWRKTKPVPAVLDGLRRLGSRSGRRAALAVEAAGVAPPSVAGDGVARPGVSVRPASAVAVPVASAAAGPAVTDDGGGGAVADADGPAERNGGRPAGPPEPESIVIDGPPADVVPAAIDSPGPPPSLTAAPPAAEVVPASAPPPAPGTSLREDG